MIVCHDGYRDVSYEISDNDCLEIDRDKWNSIAMYTGSFKMFKGLGHIEYLAYNNKFTLFYLIGDQSKCDNPHLLDKLKSYDNVQIIETILHSKIINYLKQSDILLLLPTEYGIYNDVTSPLKLFEYMSAGRAILSTDLPSIKEVLRDGRNALIAADNSVNIDKLFKRLLCDSNLRKLLGKNAKKDVRKFSWKNRTLTIIQLLNTFNNE